MDIDLDCHHAIDQSFFFTVTCNIVLLWFLCYLFHLQSKGMYSFYTMYIIYNSVFTKKNLLYKVQSVDILIKLVDLHKLSQPTAVI